jgi:hypothetical protein
VSAIDELAEKGRQAGNRKKLDRLAFISAESGKALRIARLSSSPFGVFAEPMISCMFGLGAAISTGLTLSKSSPEPTLVVVLLAGLGAGVGVTLACILLGELLARRAFNAAGDWLMGLRFPVQGYVEALAADGRCSAQVTFTGEPPPLPLVSQAADGLGLESIDVTMEHGKIEIRLATPRSREGNANYRMCRMLHRVIDGLLVPLDERFAILEVNLRKR